MRLAQFEKVIPKDLMAELKDKEKELESLKNKTREYDDIKRYTDSELDEKDEQIAKLFQENLTIQNCKEKMARIINFNRTLTFQKFELIGTSTHQSNRQKQEDGQRIKSYKERYSKANARTEKVFS